MEETLKKKKHKVVQKKTVFLAVRNGHYLEQSSSVRLFRHDVHTPNLHPTHLNLHRKERRTKNEDHIYL